MGLRAEGHDIDNEMLSMAAKNLNSFKIKYTLKKQDAAKLSKILSYVVSDLPYGKATKSQDLKKLYYDFFMVLKKHLHKKAVIGTPGFIDCKSLLKKAKLKVAKEFTHYMHRSLSKKIFVISS
jgi:tRNA G10  N-methylase Trm11